MNSIENRLSILENIVKEQNERIIALEALVNNQEEPTEEDNDSEFQINVASEYMIKLVYPGFYALRHKPTAGFPKNRKKVAEQLSTGQYMFVYVTSPEKKIIGLTKLSSNMKIVDGRWPYSVDLEWVIPIKSGVTFAEVGLSIRPRVGDTLYAITDEKAQEIIEALNAQPDLDVSTLDYLANKYKDRDHE